MLKLGNTDINKAYLGSTEIKKAYLGNTLIFDNAGFEAEYQAVLDKATLEGFALPSASVQTAQNQFVKDLKDANLWSKLETFGLFTDSNSDFARIDWANPNNVYSAFNSPSYGTSTGIGFNGVNQYLDTNYQFVSGDTEWEKMQVYWRATNYSYDGNFRTIYGVQRSTPSAWLGVIRENTNSSSWIGIPSQVNLLDTNKLISDSYYSEGRIDSSRSRVLENTNTKEENVNSVINPIATDNAFIGAVNLNGSPTFYWKGEIKYLFQLKDSIGTYEGNDGNIYNALTTYYASV